MFVAVRFNPGDFRTYTYHYDGGAQIEIGDFAVIETRDGRKAVEIMSVADEAPDFNTKPIVAVLTEKVAP